MVGFIVGSIVTSVIWLVTLALCCAAKRGDDFNRISFLDFQEGKKND